MLGLGDGQTAAALIACIGITVIGVIYGAVNWNSGDSDGEVRRRRACASDAALPRRNLRNSS